MEIRDPVHGFVELTEREAQLVDRPEFQRLRGIHQLAMAYLVYPGATHTRFDHSLGVCHIAGMLATTAGLEEDQRAQVRIAALVHDIGHGPFSHVSEYAFAACNEAAATVNTEKFHERIGLDILARLHRERVITSAERQGVENLLDPGALGATARRLGIDGADRRPAIRSVAGDIVSGPLDADKLDYLLRDSRYAGVQYGVYDLPRLVRAVRAFHDPPNSELGVVDEDISAVDQFIVATHNMWVQVYSHPIRRIADLMLVRSVVESFRAGSEDIRRIYSYDESDGFLDQYLGVQDWDLVRCILEGPEGPGRGLMQRLVLRRLLKEVFDEPLRSVRSTELTEGLWKRGTRAETAQRLECKIAETCAVCRHEVFVEVRESRPVRPREEEGPVDRSKITVVSRTGQRRSSYDQESQFFRYGELRGDDFLSVWVPIDEPDRDRRQFCADELRRRILEVVPVQEEADGKARS